MSTIDQSIENAVSLTALKILEMGTGVTAYFKLEQSRMLGYLDSFYLFSEEMIDNLKTVFGSRWFHQREVSYEYNMLNENTMAGFIRKYFYKKSSGKPEKATRDCRRLAVYLVKSTDLTKVNGTTNTSEVSILASEDLACKINSIRLTSMTAFD